MNRILTLGCLLVIFLLAGVVGGCQAKQPAVSQPQYTTTPIGRGDVTRTIYAPGELVLTDKVEISVPLDTRLLDLPVKPGQWVKTGDTLATVDTMDWDKQWDEKIKALEETLITAQRNLTARERNVTKAENQVYDAERDVIKAERRVDDKELAGRQAQLNVQMAEDNLSQIEEVKKAQDAVNKAEYDLKLARSMLTGAFVGEGGLDSSYWMQQKVHAEEELAQAQKDLQDILKGVSVKISNQVKLEVAKYQLMIEQSQRQLEDARISLEDAKVSVVTAQLAVEDAKYALENAMIAVEDALKSVADAQEALDDAREARAIFIFKGGNIFAPVDGVVLDVKYSAGETAIKDKPILVMADLNRIELIVTVGQDSIMSIKPDMTADISLDALPGTTMKGKVDYIAPQKSALSKTPTYEVYISLDNTVDGLLPGMTGGSTILTAEKHDVIRVPRRWVRPAPDGSGRVDILENGQVVAKEVVIGVKGDSYYEILSGLNEGDLVVQRGSY